MLNYENYKPRKKRKVKTEWRRRPRPPKGERTRKGGYYIYRLTDDGEEVYIATFNDPSYARAYIENVYLPRSKDGDQFLVRLHPDDVVVTKIMNFEGHAITTTPLGGLGRLP